MTATHPTVPIALSIAGSDSSGGAGIQADLKTFEALGTYGATVLTALTAQNTVGVTAVHDVPPDFVRAQLRAVFDDLDVRATKIGMLSRVVTIEAVRAELDAAEARHVVLDPVMVAASGARLLETDAVEALVRVLLPRAEVVTPNLLEAAAILGVAVAATPAEMRAQAEALRALGAQAVLVKGGHGEGAECVDVLVTADGLHTYSAPRVPGPARHGTGCSLSSAIAAGLAHGATLERAVADAKTWLTGAISAADALQVGHGAGPVFHGYRRA
jgi:hydroxymethylpyrimidine/phosphomethylpyrimidine kinase